MPDDSFKDFVLDQLHALPELRAKAMFGGYGLYGGEHFFGILSKGRLYFKADERTGMAYVERGMGPFTFEHKGRMMTMSYYELPTDVLENEEELVAWARISIAMVAAQPKKKARRR